MTFCPSLPLVALLAVIGLGCTEEEPEVDTEALECTDCTTTTIDTGTYITPEEPNRNLSRWTLSVTGLPIDETGNVVPGVTVNLGGAYGEQASPRLRLRAWWSNLNEMPFCDIWYDITASELVQTDEVFDFQFESQTLNVWRWTLTEISDDCVEPVATLEDQALIAPHRLGEVTYAAVGTPGDYVRGLGLRGVWGVWTEDELDPAAGVFPDLGFVDDRVPPVMWDGTDPFVVEDGAPASFPDEFGPGEALTNVLIRFLPLGLFL